MKIWFLILVAVVLSGCETAQQARQNEMAEARQMVRAQFGGQLTPQQEAYLSMQVFQQIEAQRQAVRIAQGQTIARGFQNLGNRPSYYRAPQTDYAGLAVQSALNSPVFHPAPVALPAAPQVITSMP